VTPFVTFGLWRLPARRVAWAAARTRLDLPHLRNAPGLRFAKMLGAGGGRSFTMRDADLRRWALFAVWESADAAEAFEASTMMRAWGERAEERWRLDLGLLRAHGLWSGRRPFGSGPGGQAPAGPSAGAAHTGRRRPGAPPGATLAVLTRARLTLRGARQFWRAVPPVADDLAGRAGLRLAVGFGETPLATLGTLSVWDDASAIADFTHRTQAHRDVIRRTAEVGWYAEQLFARFVVLASRGTVNGVDPLTIR
jgi:heme-degrading monooxygenase HmoA